MNLAPITNITFYKEQDHDALFSLLNQYQESSMFLLENIRNHGFLAGENPHSGNLRLFWHGNKLAAVAMLTKTGTVLIQSDRKDFYSDAIISAIGEENIPTIGVIAEWEIADDFWKKMSTYFPNTTTNFSSKEILYSLTLTDSPPPKSPYQLRLLTKEDFNEWYPMNCQYFEDLNFPLLSSKEERMQIFVSQVVDGYWFGLEDDNNNLITIASYNAVVGDTAQIGGVYTKKEHRNKGLATDIMKHIIKESIKTRHFTCLNLFTDIDNIPAQRVYEKLGFVRTGHLGLIFGNIL